MRLFVAIDPDAASREGLRRELSRLRPLSPASKWARADGLHLTLAFLGETDPALVPAIREAMEAVAATFAPFELEVRGGGTFGSRAAPRVVWAGLGGDIASLALLKTALEEALAPTGHQPEGREFTPHLTLARSRSHRGDRALALAAEELASLELGRFRIEELILYRSETAQVGAHYSVITRARFDKGSPSGEGSGAP